ncbi:MAG: endonuclease [Chitinivibrionia bacterium]|nr:endonuclease [Chitinivibrionia bacterium]MCL1947757.1 endonuclease [Chitinivibrionia bacterium]
MKKNKNINIFKVIFLLFAQYFAAFAQIPQGYYDAAQGKIGAELKSALHEIILDHTPLSYDALWTAFEKTDVAEDGAVWDMYSECVFEFFINQCGRGNARTTCDCYNREHSFPKSWFGGEIMPMFTDLFHLYPTDAIINSQRNNFPYGEVGETNTIKENGKGKYGRARAGLGHTGTVYEPDDEYKGDFARTYFYIVTRYEDIIEDWYENAGAKQMLDGSPYPAFKEWALQMLLRWHENDPVSQKEIDRNNEIYKLQENRNPFIDNPLYVRNIWLNEPQIVAVNREFYNKKGTVSIVIQNRILRINANAKNIQKARIYSANGKIIKEFNENSVDLSGLSKGIYLLKLPKTSLKFTLE